MTLLNEPGVPAPAPRSTSLGRKFVAVITSTDHKTIGRMYLVTSFIFFLVGGVLLSRVDMRRGIIQAGNSLPKVL